jgi:hypothetical protein
MTADARNMSTNRASDPHAPSPSVGWELFEYKHEALGRWHFHAGMRVRLVLQVEKNSELSDQMPLIIEYEIDRIELHEGVELLVDHITVQGHRYRRAR